MKTHHSDRTTTQTKDSVLEVKDYLGVKLYPKIVSALGDGKICN